jgi:apolipoprotein D and lipocalin family protein
MIPHRIYTPNNHLKIDSQPFQFLGIWYAVQKTSTASECVIYNITTGEEPGEYLIQQISQNFLLGWAPLKHKYSYTGILEKTHADVPAKMKVRFPLSVAGSAGFTVFMTDYENYAGIFSCQKLPVGNRHSATILSRTKELEKAYVDKVGSY